MKDPGKVIGVAESGVIGHLSDGKFFVRQQLSGGLQTNLPKNLPEGKVEMAGDLTTAVARGQVEVSGDIGKAYIGLVVFLNELSDISHKWVFDRLGNVVEKGQDATGKLDSERL